MTSVRPPVAGAQPWVRRVISLVVVLVVVIATGLWWWRAHRTGVRFTGLFTSAVGVYPGSDVRILGVPVGEVDSVTPAGNHVVIRMHLDPGVHATASTAAVIISPNLVSDRYVQLTGVYTHGAKLGNGAIIPLTRTRTPVELDDLYASLLELTDALGPNGANRDGALTRVLDTGAANLGGNGTDLNRTITQLSEASGTLAGSKDHIFATIDNLSQFTTMLKTNNAGLIKVNQELVSVTGTLADDRQAFGAAMQNLSSALVLVQQFVHDNRAALAANVAKLNTVAATLAAERDSLVKALQSAPLVAQNFVDAYDPQRNVLRGRADLNEVSVWSAAADSAQSAGPPALLPSTNVATGGSR